MLLDLHQQVPVFVQEFHLRVLEEAYGVPAYDLDFGLGSRDNAVDPQISNRLHHHSLQQMQE